MFTWAVFLVGSMLATLWAGIFHLLFGKRKVPCGKYERFFFINRHIRSCPAAIPVVQLFVFNTKRVKNGQQRFFVKFTRAF